MNTKPIEKWDVTAERDDYTGEIDCYRMTYLGWTIGFYDTLAEAEQAGRDFRPIDGDARFRGVL